MARKDYESIVTPIGVAIYPHLNRPDAYKDPNTGVSGKPQYKVNLSLTQQEATPIIEKIEASKKIALGMIPAGKKTRETDDPYYNELDSEGQETGRVVFKFKMNAEIYKDGRTIEMSPKLFDAGGSLLSDCDDIWGGSKLRVSADMIPYYVASVGAGVSLRLKAVQIIEPKTGGGGDASSYGFEATQGFTATPVATAQDEGFSDEDEDF
jgi:hypothetical protein